MMTARRSKKAVDDVLVMAYRNLLKFKHNPAQLVDVIINPLFFMLIFVYLFGGAIAGDTQSYLPIIVPGVLVQSLLGCSSATGTQLSEDIQKGIFDRFRSLPMVRMAPLVGSLLADIPRYVIAVSVAVMSGFLMGWRPVASGVWVLFGALFILFVTFSISWIFAMVGLLVKKAVTIQVLSQTILMILTFTSNAFVPTETMPRALQWFVHINPVTHLISALRMMFTEGAIGGDFWLTVGMSVVIVVVFAPLTLRVYNRKI